MENEDRYLSTASWGKTEPTYEAKQFLLALIIKSRINSNKLNIIDAGAGLGRNSIYLSKNGFSVTAVEYDRGAIAPLKSNIEENNQLNNIVVINSNILDFLKKQNDHSIDALLDSGMSHYLTLDEKKEYFMLLKQKMTDDGLFSITHFSKEDDSAIGLSKDELEKLIGGMIPLDEIHFDSWIDSISKSNHFAWKSLLVMPGGHHKEIQDKYKKLYKLIQEKKITSIEQIYEYLEKDAKSIKQEVKGKKKSNAILVSAIGATEDIVRTGKINEQMKQIITTQKDKIQEEPREQLQ